MKKKLNKVDLVLKKLDELENMEWKTVKEYYDKKV